MNTPQDPTTWVYEEDTRHDLKRHEQGRVKNGFSTYDWWNFNDYLTWVIVQGLEKFKDGAGFPCTDDIKTMDDWRVVLDKMIAGFNAQHRLMNDYEPATIEADRAAWEEGSALFIKFYSTLWD